jgi:nicotinamide-nucleotide amidase
VGVDVDEGIRMVEDLAHEVATLARTHHLHVAVAESLTGGDISRRLAAAPDSSEWFLGGVVAYAPEAKWAVLGVDRGPVVTEGCARQMAVGAADLFGATLTVAVTGVGGPDAEEGQPPGTVWLATRSGSDVTACRHRFEGSPRRSSSRPPSTRCALSSHGART